ncbi:MAG TPA: flippase [Caldilinea sp.]|nr:flippase [Caldilinea sp.]
MRTYAFEDNVEPDSIEPTGEAAAERSTRSATILKNASIITLGAMMLKLINFVYNVAVVRQLGDAGYGQFATVVSFVGLFGIFAELGISQYVMREIARHPEKSNDLFWNLVFIRLALAAVGVAGITAAAVAYGYPPELVQGVALYTLTFVWASLHAPVETLLTANEKFNYVTSMSVVGQITTITLGAVVLYNDWGFIALIGVGLIAMAPPTLLGIWGVRRHHLLHRPISLHLRMWPEMIRRGLPFGFISLSLTIAFTVDSVMLSRFEAAEVVGWYSAAYNLARSLLFFFDGISVAMVPTLSRAYLTDTHLVQRWYFRSVKVILLMGLPIATGSTIIALPLFLFLYGDQYLPAVLAFQIIVWDVPLLLFTSFCGNMTTVVGQERAAARIYFSAAIANVILNLLLIPTFSLYGAAVATLLTDLAAAVQFYWVLGRRLELPNLSSIAARVALSCGSMAAILLVLQWAGAALWVLIPAGMVVYLVMVLLTQILDEEERRLVVRVVNRLGWSRS